MVLATPKPSPETPEDILITIVPFTLLTARQKYRFAYANEAKVFIGRLSCVYVCYFPDFPFKPLILEYHKYPSLHQKEGFNSCWKGRIGELVMSLSQSKQDWEMGGRNSIW